MRAKTDPPSLADLGLWIGTNAALLEIGITTPEDLFQTPFGCLQSAPLFGKRRLADVLAAAERAGVALPPSLPWDKCRCPVHEFLRRREENRRECRDQGAPLSTGAQYDYVVLATQGLRAEVDAWRAWYASRPAPSPFDVAKPGNPDGRLLRFPDPVSEDTNPGA
jgi:hypothetical protein